MTGKALIELVDVSKRFTKGRDTIAIFDHLGMTIPEGDFIAIMGPSGSGKTTLLNLLGGIDTPSSGEIRFAGQRIDGLNEAELARWRAANVGFVFQFYNLMPMLTALQNVELPMIYAGVPPAARRARAAELLDRVGLGSRMGHRPTQLSGGQQQRVAIARSLSNRPDLLLADEPTGALDSHTGEEVLKLFHELNDDGLTLAIVTHDPDVAHEAHRRVAFRDGLIVSDERHEVRA